MKWGIASEEKAQGGTITASRKTTGKGANCVQPLLVEQVSKTRSDPEFQHHHRVEALRYASRVGGSLTPTPAGYFKSPSN